MATVSIRRPVGSRPAARFDPWLLVPAAVVLVLIYLTAWPLFWLVAGSFRQEVEPNVYVLTIGNYLEAYSDPSVYRLFLNSFLFAVGTSIVALAIGAGLAWIVERTNTPGRHYFYGLTLVPIIIPGVLFTISWIFLLSPKIGFINVVLAGLLGTRQGPFDVFSLGGMIWVEGLHLSPLAFLLMSAAFKSMDPSLEESSMTSGGGTLATLKRITLPLMLPAAASSLLLLFVRGLEAFETPAFLGIPSRVLVFTTDIFLALRTYPPNFGLAGALAVSLLVLSALGVWAYTRATASAERFQTVTGKAFRPRVIELGGWRWVTCALFVVYFLLVVGLPFFILLWSSFMPFYAVPSLQMVSRMTLDNYAFLFKYPRVLLSIQNSFLLGVGSATIIVMLTAIISWITVKTRLPGRGALDVLAFLPIGIPGLVLGVSFILLYVTFPVPIYGTIWILLVAYVTRFLPYGMRANSSAMVQIHKELEEASHVSGGSWWITFTRVILPLLRPGLVAGWIYIFVISVRELSTSILLATGESMVLSVMIFDMFDSGQFNTLAALAVIFILSLVVIVAVVHRVSGRFGVRE